MNIRSYKDLIVWQKSCKLVTGVYILTKLYPKDEIYGIISQMRRASISIPSNIAEGFGRRSQKEHNQFLSMAYGSALELETQIISGLTQLALNPIGIASAFSLAMTLTCVSPDYKNVDSLLLEIMKMLNKMIYKVMSSSS